jgi:hypothetical protein
VLQQQLLDHGIRSKMRVTKGGRPVGGEPFSRGALFYLLRNRIYRGMIMHKGEEYVGSHEAIVDAELFDAVQALLKRNGNDRVETSRARCETATLTGRLFDADGHPMSPTTSRGKGGKLYRYYVSAPLQQGLRVGSDGDQITRVPAEALERLLYTITKKLIQPKAPNPLSILQRVEVHAHSLELLLPMGLFGIVKRNLGKDEWAFEDDGSVRVVLPIRLRFRGGHASVDAGSNQAPRPHGAIVKALRAGHAFVHTSVRMFPCPLGSPESPYLRRLIRLAMLAPDIQRALLEGWQPTALTLERLTRSRVPLLWVEQRRQFGFGNADLGRG